MPSEIDRRDPAAPAIPVRDGGPGLVRHLAADLRRAGRPDRGHAAHARRREAVDRPAPVPARPELLHAAARPRGPAAGHLRRLAAARHPRRPGRRRPVRAARAWSRCWRCPRSTSRSARRPRSTALFAGLAPAVLAIVAQAVVRVGKRALTSPRPGRRSRSPRSSRWRCSPCRSRSSSLVAGLARLGAGTGGGRPRAQPGSRKDDADDGPAPVIPDDALHTERPSTRRTRHASCVVGLLVWGVPVAAVALLTGAGQRLHRAGPVLLRRRRGHLRRRLRRARLRRPAGGRGLRLAGAGGDGARPRAGRDHARAADHGGAVRRVPRRLPRPRRRSTRGSPRSSRRCWSPG